MARDDYEESKIPIPDPDHGEGGARVSENNHQ